MGRAGKWFRSLFSYLKSTDSSPAKEKNKRGTKWSSLSASGDVGDPMASPFVGGIDASRHAIAVAAATAAVAEAALTAAQAAAEVVRLTSGGRSGRGAPESNGDRRRTVAAAVKIQSAFRAYLARKALKALKGLVKLQALVRGYIVRKQSTDMLRRMHAMARIQARASKHRSYPPESPYAKNNFSNTHHQVKGITNTRRYEERSKSVINGGSLIKPDHSRSHSGIKTNNENSQIASRWLNHWMEQCASEKSLHETSLDKRSDKILEIDTWKPHANKTRTNQVTPTSYYFSAWNEPGPEYTKAGPISRPSSKHHKPNPSISSEDDQVPACVADGSPRVHSSASCRPAGNSRGPSFTPARSECSRSLFGDYIGGHPSYMANTESSRAKVRSYSAPKQRMQREGSGLSANFGGGDFWECSDTFSEKGLFLPGNNRGGGNNRYSGQVNRQGTPARDAGVGFSSVYGRRM